MINRLIEWSLRNRFLVVCGVFFLIAFGTRALFRTPVDAIPDLSENQVIVFADCDFDRTVEEVATAGVMNAGQDCAAGCRVLVEESIADRFIPALAARVAQFKFGVANPGRADFSIDTAHCDELVHRVASTWND